MGLLCVFFDAFAPVAGHAGGARALKACLWARWSSTWRPSAWPRPYDVYPHNLTAAGEELARMVRFKAGWVKASGVAFVLASLLLTAAAVMLVWAAG